MKARVTVTLKAGVLDPQGQAIQGSLRALGFEGISGVRQGKVFDIDLAAGDAAAAMGDLRRMCEKLLANTVIENFAIEIGASDASSAADIAPLPVEAPVAEASVTAAPQPPDAAEPEAADEPVTAALSDTTPADPAASPSAGPDEATETVGPAASA